MNLGIACKIVSEVSLFVFEDLRSIKEIHTLKFRKSAKQKVASVYSLIFKLFHRVVVRFRYGCNGLDDYLGIGRSVLYLIYKFSEVVEEIFFLER